MTPEQYIANLKAVGINVPLDVECSVQQFDGLREALDDERRTSDTLRAELREMETKYEVMLKMCRERTITLGDVAVGTGIRMKELQQMLVDGGVETRVEERPYNGAELRLKHLVCIISRLNKRNG